MALQDLTPQLRTRLSRMERAVGWFIFFATLLLLFGFGYYIYSTAERKGWFKIKAPYCTYADSGDGLDVGDPIKLMGFTAGRITQITAMPPWGSEHNVYVEFEILEPFYGYLWTTGSVAELSESGFLGKRQLNLRKGTGGYATYVDFAFRDKMSLSEAGTLQHPDKWRLAEDIYQGTNLQIKAWVPLTPENLQKISAMGIPAIRALDTSTHKKKLTAVWSEKLHGYETFSKTNLYSLPPDETPPLTTRLQAVVTQVEVALPNILALTNQLAVVLSNSTRLTSNLNDVAENVRPVITNLSVITTQLRNPKGSLGEWLIPTNINSQLETTLQNADGAVANLNTNLITLNRSLDNLAGITSNLNQQVQVNSNIVSNVSNIIVHSDEFVQGLKRFWLFRHLFKEPKAKRPPKPAAGAVQRPASEVQQSPKTKAGGL